MFVGPNLWCRARLVGPLVNTMLSRTSLALALLLGALTARGTSTLVSATDALALCVVALVYDVADHPC